MSRLGQRPANLRRGAVGALLACAVATAAPARAQELRAAPDGSVIGALRDADAGRRGATRAGWQAVALEGWIAAFRVGNARAGDATVQGGEGILRTLDHPTRGAVIATFVPGARLTVLQQRGTWARVRREAFVRVAGAARATDAASRPAASARQAPAAGRAAAPAAPEPAPEPTPDSAAYRTARDVRVLAAPGGPARATLPAGTVVRGGARDRGWVRVRVEGWVREAELQPGDSALRTQVSAADLRADPDGTRGTLVRWTVTVLALQRGDPLRKGLAPEEPYLLARGPATENALLYLAVPPSLVEAARAVPPLTAVTITARVRDGRSEPVGVPVLDVLALDR